MKKKIKKFRNPATIPAKSRKAGAHKPKKEKRQKKDDFLKEDES
jgi:hypothetical protein